jgi:hypothetical protein
VQSSTVKVCACGHQEETHEHYRAGSDCGICGRSSCDRYLHGPILWMRTHLWSRSEPCTEPVSRPHLRRVK